MTTTYLDYEGDAGVYLGKNLVLVDFYEFSAQYGWQLTKADFLRKKG